MVALKLVVLRGERLTYEELGKRLKLSQFEAHAAAKRLVAAKLATEIEGEIRPIIATLKNFIYYGAPYAFPPVRGEMMIGFPTAYGVNPLNVNLRAIRASDSRPNEATLMWRFVVLDGVAF